MPPLALRLLEMSSRTALRHLLLLGLCSSGLGLPTEVWASAAEAPEAAAETSLAEQQAQEVGLDDPEADGSGDAAPSQEAADQAAAEAGASNEGAGEVSTDGSGLGLFSGAGGGTATTPAAAAAASPAAPVATSPWRFDFNGYVRGDVFVGKALDRRMADVKAAYGEAALQFRVHRERFGDAFAETRLRYGYDGRQATLAVDLREAYVNAYLGPVDIRVGHQIIVWGRADGINPTNQLMPIDLRIRSPIEDDRRLGNFGVRMFLNFAPVRIEGVWLPLYSPVRIPAVPIDEMLALEDARVRPDLSNGLGAGRFHLEFSKIEMSASYIYGRSPLPGLALGGYDVGENAVVRIVRRPYKQHVAGFDFSTAIGNIIGIRGEIAYRHPVNHRARVYAARPDLNYVFGLDREFGPVSIILQYVGTYVFDWAKEGGAAALQDQGDFEFELATLRDFREEQGETFRPLIEQGINAELRLNNQILFSQIARHQHSLATRIQWLTLHDTLSFSAAGMFNITTFEWLLYPKIEYRFSDRMLTAIGGEIYSGPPGTRLDWIDGLLSAGYLELRFLF